MRSLLRIAMMAGLLMTGASGAAQAACAAPDGAKAQEVALLDWINSERASRGLKPYHRNNKLDRAAQMHACDMVAHNYFNHSRPGGPKLGTRIKGSGYRLKAANENIAYARHPNAETAARIWRNSPPHWAAILDPNLRDIGISLTTGNGKVYWVMDVARPKAS